MQNLRCKIHAEGRFEGIIIYPVVNAVLREDFLLAGNKIRVCTLELNAPWEQISLQMKEIAEGCKPAFQNAQ